MIFFFFFSGEGADWSLILDMESCFLPLKSPGGGGTMFAMNIVETYKAEIQTEYIITSFFKSNSIVLLHIWIINQALHFL